MVKYINSISFEDFLSILAEIGTIPERIIHDSTEEKLYSKVTDIILSRSFSELGWCRRIICIPKQQAKSIHRL